MDNRYSARSLSLRLGNRQIIHDVSLQLCGGGMTALIGPNGAGKSTLLRLLTGYLTPDGGVRVVEGRPLESWSAETLSRRRAVMLQRTQLHADWPVETVIAMGRYPPGDGRNRLRSSGRETLPFPLRRRTAAGAAGPLFDAAVARWRPRGLAVSR